MENDLFPFDELPDADGLLSEETIYDEVDRYYDDLEDVLDGLPEVDRLD